MRHKIKIFIVLLACYLLPGAANAITVTTTQNPAETGEKVVFETRVSFESTPGCAFVINYGDGSGWQTLAYCNSAACTFSSNYTYGKAGVYNVQVESRGVCGTPPAPPDPSTPLPIEILDPVSLGTARLPVATAGMKYRYQFQASGGTEPYTYKLVSSRLPVKLKLNSTGLLSGIPKKLGKYRFFVKVTDSKGKSFQQEYKLIVDQTPLQVKTSPAKQFVSRNKQSSFKFSYIFSTKEKLNDTLHSPGGEFWAGSRKLGTFNKPMTVKLRNGKAKTSETVMVPLSVIKSFKRLNLKEIGYQRIFTSDFMKTKTVASTVVSVRLGFNVSKIRLFFSNNRPKITCKRNQRLENAGVELRVQGKGLLKGYFEVDGRILSRIQKTLSYSPGKKIILKLPEIPPLPTYSLGPHRLKFIVTQPVMDIRFPEAIYFVTGDDLQGLAQIALQLPEDKSVIDINTQVFSWKPAINVASSQIEFFQTDMKEPFFSAYTKETSYTVPAPVIGKNFKQGMICQWQVKGYDSNGKIIKASKMRSFTVQ